MTFARLAVALLFLVIATVACLMPAQSDTYWQLRAGQEMVATGQVLLRDTFTHSVAGGYWPNHEWASEVLFFLLQRVGGMPLLTAFAAGLVLVSWALVWRLMRGHDLLRLVLVLAVLVPSARLWSLRPQLISLVCLALLLWLLARRREGWLPLLFFAWANFHGGVTLGVAALAGGLAGLVWADRPRWRRAALVFGACVAATCLTPLGVTLWTEVPQMLARLGAYNVQEWRRASVTDPTNLPFWAAAAALMLLAARRWRAIDREGAILAGAAFALLPLAVSSTRNITPFLLAAAPAIAALLPAGIVRWAPRARRERPGLNVALLASTGAACLALVAAGWSRPFDRLNWHPISATLARAIGSCPGNLYNLYDNGGYLVWFVPGTPVFIDSRQDPFPVALVADHIQVERSGDYHRLFEGSGIGCAAVPPTSKLVARLQRDGWSTIGADARWVVLAETRAGE